VSAAKDRLKALLPKGAFGRSVAILAGGTAIAAGWGEGAAEIARRAKRDA